MTTAAQMRRFIATLPESTEGEHMGHPDFRVRNRIFATLSPEEKRAVLRLPKGVQTALLESDPQTFGTAWGATGWTSVVLRTVRAPRFMALLVEAWRGVAPKRLVAEFDARSVD